MRDSARVPAAEPARVYSTRPDGPQPTVTAYENDEDEVLGVAQALRRAHNRGVPWSRLAVLARTNALVLNMKEALRSSAVPTSTPDSGAAAAFAELDRVMRITGQSGRSAGAKPFHVLVSRLTDLVGSATPASGDHTEPVLAMPVPGDVSEESMRTLLSCAREYRSEDPSSTLDGFRDWLAAATTRSPISDEPQASVALMSFHRSKGLEWEEVFLIGLEDGLVPMRRASSAQGAIAEERRLLHVAMTRAERGLHCSWARARTVGERKVKRSMSPYLAAIVSAATTEGVDGRPLRGLKDLIATERARLATISVPDLDFGG
jgi:DNA helicase-2/ATP-dependent DNA helicase PcrA